MLSEEKLIGWLCIMRLNLDTRPFDIPNFVRDSLIAKGWITVDTEADEDGLFLLRVTAAGLKITDLQAAEWGINPLWSGDS